MREVGRRLQMLEREERVAIFPTDNGKFRWKRLRVLKSGIVLLNSLKIELFSPEFLFSQKIF